MCCGGVCLILRDPSICFSVLSWPQDCFEGLNSRPFLQVHCFWSVFAKTVETNSLQTIRYCRRRLVWATKATFYLNNFPILDLIFRHLTCIQNTCYLPNSVNFSFSDTKRNCNLPCSSGEYLWTFYVLASKTYFYLHYNMLPLCFKN